MKEPDAARQTDSKQEDNRIQALEDKLDKLMNIFSRLGERSPSPFLRPCRLDSARSGARHTARSRIKKDVI